MSAHPEPPATGAEWAEMKFESVQIRAPERDELRRRADSAAQLFGLMVGVLAHDDESLTRVARRTRDESVDLMEWLGGFSQDLRRDLQLVETARTRLIVALIRVEMEVGE